MRDGLGSYLAERLLSDFILNHSPEERPNFRDERVIALPQPKSGRTVRTQGV